MHKRLHIVIGLVLVLLAMAQPAEAIDYNDAATGNWGTSTTRSPAGIPGENDTVTIDSHTVTLVEGDLFNGISDAA